MNFLLAIIILTDARPIPSAIHNRRSNDYRIFESFQHLLLRLYFVLALIIPWICLCILFVWSLNVIRGENIYKIVLHLTFCAIADRTTTAGATTTTAVSFFILSEKDLAQTVSQTAIYTLLDPFSHSNLPLRIYASLLLYSLSVSSHTFFYSSYICTVKLLLLDERQDRFC